MGNVFSRNDHVQVLRGKQRVGVFRFLAHLSHNGLADQGIVVEKIPLRHIRTDPPIDASSDSHVEVDSVVGERMAPHGWATRRYGYFIFSWPIVRFSRF